MAGRFFHMISRPFIQFFTNTSVNKQYSNNRVLVQFLGKIEVDTEYGADVIREAVSALLYSENSLKEMFVSFTWLGLHLEDIETGRIRVFPIGKISYAIVDSVFDCVLSCIIKTSDLLECHCFIFEKPKKAKIMLNNFEKAIQEARQMYVSGMFRACKNIGIDNVAYDHDDAQNSYAEESILDDSPELSPGHTSGSLPMDDDDNDIFQTVTHQFAIHHPIASSSTNYNNPV